MARRDSVAFPASHQGLLWRRHSEPASSGKIFDSDAITGSHGNSKSFRRYSFSALEEYQRVNGSHNVYTTGDHRVDLTPLGIRDKVDQVLQENGFKDAAKTKVAQMRRYSNYVDKDVANPLGAKTRRESFGSVAAVVANSNRYDGGYRNLDTNHSRSITDKNKTAGKDSVSKSQKEFARNCYKIINAWENSKKDLHNYPKSHFINHLMEHDTASDVGSESKFVLTDVDEHLQQKRSLWEGRCQRDSISKFRNRVIDALRPHTETDTEYWRRCRSAFCDEESSKFPKCNYRLREDGLIASELPSATKVDIDDNVKKITQSESSSSPRDSITRPTSATTTTEFADVLCSLIKRRRKSSLFSNCDVSRRASLQRSISSLSDRNSCHESSDVNAPAFQRSFSRQDSTISEADFYQRFSVLPSTRDMVGPSESYLAQRRASLKGQTGEKRRWSLTPSEGFELIGSTALHGTPGCKGRLMLLTARTVRFDDEFKKCETLKTQSIEN